VGRDEFLELPIPLIAWQEYPDPAIQALFDAEIHAFLASIDGTAAPPVDVYEGAAIAAVLDAIAASIASGCPVLVGDGSHPRPRNNRQF
jgi:predicted dehydrogenase